jgi:hypothetical protein
MTFLADFISGVDIYPAILNLGELGFLTEFLLGAESGGCYLGTMRLLELFGDDG